MPAGSKGRDLAASYLGCRPCEVLLKAMRWTFARDGGQRVTRKSAEAGTRCLET